MTRQELFELFTAYSRRSYEFRLAGDDDQADYFARRAEEVRARIN